MNLEDIARIRLYTQQIASSRFTTAREVVGWMGAMQAQDYAMSKWALGVRLPGSTERGIRGAVDRGEVLRTHLMRPTWHLVSADDIYWLLALTVPHIKAGSRSRHNQQGLTPEIFRQSNAVIEKALAGGRHLTRQELVAGFEKANIPLGDNRAAHLLYWAELEGLVCSGPEKNGKPTYALLEEQVPKPPDLTREEALAKLAGRYFASHGPATLPDFTWWSGLPIRDARRALELVRSNLISETIDGQVYWFDESVSVPAPEGEIVKTLPAYDEYIISYTDRGASLTSENAVKAVSRNGIFYPVIVVDGRVIGIWKRTTKKDKVVIETELFVLTDETSMALIEKEFLNFGRFMEKEISIWIKM
ncbi:MAG: winged helix DNA-binding domain-containing protein [Anaerolineaceae bacterium]